MLSDIKFAINSRPLTYLDSNTLTVLSPNSFLRCDGGKSVVFGSLDGSDLEAPTRKEILFSLKKREEMLTVYRDLWYEQYLLSLRESARDAYQKDWSNQISTGEVVLISSSIKNRGFWQLGIVTKLLPGNDGLVRTVKVRRHDNSQGVYPINLLYPMELSLSAPLKSKISGAETPIEQPTSRKKRTAAIRCMEKLRTI